MLLRQSFVHSKPASQDEQAPQISSKSFQDFDHLHNNKYRQMQPVVKSLLAPQGPQKPQYVAVIFYF